MQTMMEQGQILPAEKAVFTIGSAANMLDLHPRTLRIYESEGLIRPARQGKWRYYSMDDIKWIGCLRKMIHDQGISIAAIQKLLAYTPCWNIADCPFEKRKQCTAFMSCGLVSKKIDMRQIDHNRKRETFFPAS